MRENFIKILMLGWLLSGGYAFGQEQDSVANFRGAKYYGREKKYVDFTNDRVKFNSWSIGVYGGIPVLHSTELKSFTKDNKGWGYDVQLALTKQITHAFGLKFLGQYGKTKQFSHLNKGAFENDVYSKGETNYWGVSLFVDLNFTSLLRRVDNKSRYRWALHGYVGPGMMYYTAKQNSFNGSTPNNLKYSYIKKIKLSSGLGSILFQGGLGFKYKISGSLDAELINMWICTGDEAFDGLSNRRGDSFFTTSLGLTYTLGSNPESLFWYDPLQVLYPPKMFKVALKVCKKGDKDNDGVCNDWDKELDTPFGARVDGSGRALDVDLDGVIDLYDKCVTIPGPAFNQGCPLPEKEKKPILKKEFDIIGQQKLKKINKKLEGILFDLGKYDIKKEYERTLEEAAGLMNEYSDTEFKIVGHTDASGAIWLNFELSRKRAQAVKKILVEKGVKELRLNIVAKGKSELKYPQCSGKNYEAKDCTSKNPETGLSKNDENRRVEFVPIEE